MQEILSDDLKSISGFCITFDLHIYFVRYKYTCKYSKGLQRPTATFTNFIEVKAGQPPKVFISLPEKQKINPSDTLTLKGVIKSKHPVSYAWSCVDESGEDFYLLKRVSCMNFKGGPERRQENIGTFRSCTPITVNSINSSVNIFTVDQGNVQSNSSDDN